MLRTKHRSSTYFIIRVAAGLLFFAALYLVTPVLGAYIGPDRTVTETVREGEGWGRECQLVGGQYKWVTTTTCGGCSASCVSRLESQYPDHNPGSICNPSYLGSRVHDYSCEIVDRKITYQPATISSTVTCADPGSSGWCRSDAVVRLTGSEGADACGAYGLTWFEDNQGNSAPAAGCSASTAFTIVSGGSTSFQAWVHSSLGDTSEMTRETILIDKTPPTLTATQPDLFTLALSGTDAHSGIDHFEVNINGAGWVTGASHALLPGVNDIQMRAFDRAGNMIADRAVIITDAGPPEVLLDAILPAAPDGERGWYLSAPMITVSAADSQTGIAFAGIVLDGTDRDAQAGYQVGDGVHAVQIKAVDGAGNARLEAPISFASPLKVDTIPPALLVAITPAPIAGDWYDAPVLVDAGGCFDALSGLDLIGFDLNGAGFEPGSSLVLQEGQHHVSVQASDLAGNQALAAYTLNVDLNPPYASPTVSGRSGPVSTHGPWFSGPVVVRANAGDDAGGPITVESSVNGAAFTAASEETIDAHGGHTVAFRVTDPVGRMVVERVDFGIDLNAPEVSITSHADGKTVSGALRLAGTAFDDLSGVYQIELKVGEGDWSAVAPAVVDADRGTVDWLFDLSVSTIKGGPLVFAVRAQDRAGSYSPEQEITLVVNNHQARLEIPDRWLSGQTIIPRHVRGDTGGVVRAEAVVSHPRLGSQKIPLRGSNQWAVRWNGLLGSPGSWAPPGDYTVIVTSWDQYGHTASDQGVIVMPELADGPTMIPPTLEKIEIYGQVETLDGEGVVIDGETYLLTADSALAPGIGPETLAYGQGEKGPGPVVVLWLKPAVEVAINGVVETLAAQNLQVDGQRYELTANSQLPEGLATGARVTGAGLEDGRGAPDVLWLELVGVAEIPFSGTVSAYQQGDALTVDGTVYAFGAETTVESQSGLAVGDQVTGWYLADGLWLVSVSEIEPVTVEFEGAVAARTETALAVEETIYRLVAASVLPETLAPGFLVRGSAFLFADGHHELIEAKIIPGSISGVVTRVEGRVVYINNAPYLVSGKDARLRAGQAITGWVDEHGRLSRLRVVSRVGTGVYLLTGALLLGLGWLLAGRGYRGTLISSDPARRRFTLRLTDAIEDPKLRTLRFDKGLDSAVRLHQGRWVRGRVVLFRARTMREGED